MSVEESILTCGGIAATLSLVALAHYSFSPCFEIQTRTSTLGHPLPQNVAHLGALYALTSRCDGGLLYAEKDFPDDYSETERFLDVLQYHRSLLPDYINRWMKRPSTSERVSWPKSLPSEREIGALELDHSFCRRSPEHPGANTTCHDLKFRIAAFYLSREDPELKKKGFYMVKDLAEKGHADGMCYYGRC